MSEKTEGSSTQIEDAEIVSEEMSGGRVEPLALPETTVSETIGNAFGGTVQDAEKARETASPWDDWKAEPTTADVPSSYPASESAAPELDDDEEDEKPKRGRRKMSPEEKAQRDAQRRQEKLAEAEALLQMVDGFYLGKVQNELRPLLPKAQLDAFCERQKLKPDEIEKLKPPLADTMVEEDIEFSPMTRLAMVAFAVYRPRLEELKYIKEQLSPPENEDKK